MKRLRFQTKLHLAHNLLSMADLVAINMMRKAQGLQPLTELPKDLQDNKGGDPPPAKTPEEIEKERLAAEGNKGGDNTPGELDDAALLQLLEKRGIKAASLDELKPKDPDEDPELTAEKLEAAKLTYGLEKGLFNKKTYDNFISESKAPQNLVLAEFYADAKKSDPNLTDDEITAEFREEYGLDAEPTSRKFLRGKKNLETRAEKLMNEKYGKVLSLDNEFKTHQDARKAESERKKAILAKTPQYKKDVQSIFTELRKITTKFSDTESYEANLVESDINEIMNDFLKPEAAEKMIEEGYTPEKLKDTAFMVLLKQKFPVIAKELIKQALLKNQKGAHGIPDGSNTGDAGGDGTLTESQKAYRVLNEKANPKEAATT